MKIAILGTRGIPNHYGGFEQYAELLSVFLQENGWEVYVYNSHKHPYQEKTYKNVHIIHQYDPEYKLGTFGQFIYDLNCIRNTRREDFDIIYQLGYTSSAIFNFLFPQKSIIVTNMDGLEWKRTKYNKPVQRFLKYSEKIAVKRSNFLIADSIGIQDYLKEKYKVDSFFSAYTAEIPRQFNDMDIKAYGLQAKKYNLLIARLEPENNVETIMDAHTFNAINTPLIVIGNHETPFGDYLKNKFKAFPHIQFLGSIYKKELLDSIRYYSQIYFHGHSVGGTNPSLLEAMACSCNIIAHNNIFNKGVLGENAHYFKDSKDLNHLICNFDQEQVFYNQCQKENKKKIEDTYSACHIFKNINEYFMSLLEK